MSIAPNNIAATIILLLQALKVPVTKSSVVAELGKHPAPNSLLAISDLLNNWRVENRAFVMDPESLKNIPPPFIIHLNINEGLFAVVTDINSDHIKISSDLWKTKKITTGELEQLFSGNVLAVRKNGDSGEIDYLENKFREKMKVFRRGGLLFSALLLLIAFLLTTPLAINTIPNFLISIYFIKLSGIIVSILLLAKVININNEWVNKVCETLKGNCNTILSSKAAYLLPGVSWSEVGFVYFSATFLMLIMSEDNQNVVILFNLLSLPYTLYSVYYQSKVAKQYCVLCLIVQALLWIEFKLEFPYLNLLFHPYTAINLLHCALAILCPIVLWTLLRPYLLLKQQLSSIEKQLHKYKHNLNYFQHVLTNQERMPLFDKTQSIILGNAAADKVITIVSDPFCRPCSTAHKFLHAWLQTRQDIQVQILFLVTNDIDPKVAIARHMMALHKELDNQLLQKALYEWYNDDNKNFDSWIKRYPVEHVDLVDNEIFKEQFNWNKIAKIESTPTIFLNGYKLNSPYKLEDIKYFI